MPKMSETTQSSNHMSRTIRPSKSTKSRKGGASAQKATIEQVESTQGFEQIPPSFRPAKFETSKKAWNYTKGAFMGIIRDHWASQARPFFSVVKTSKTGKASVIEIAPSAIPSNNKHSLPQKATIKIPENKIVRIELLQTVSGHSEERMPGSIEKYAKNGQYNLEATFTPKDGGPAIRYSLRQFGPGNPNSGIEFSEYKRSYKGASMNESEQFTFVVSVQFELRNAVPGVIHIEGCPDGSAGPYGFPEGRITDCILE